MWEPSRPHSKPAQQLKRQQASRRQRHDTRHRGYTEVTRGKATNQAKQ